MAVEDVEGGTRRTTSWLKQHIVEIIGAIIALILLVFAWKAKSGSGTTTVAPASTGAANQNAAQDTSQFATLSDLTNAIQGATQQEQQDVANLTAQIANINSTTSQSLAGLRSTLSSAEQADVQSLTAQLQAQQTALTNAQQSLHSAIAAAQAADQSALASGLQQQSSALSSLQAALNAAVANQASPQTLDTLRRQFNAFAATQYGQAAGIQGVTASGGLTGLPSHN